MSSVPASHKCRDLSFLAELGIAGVFFDVSGGGDRFWRVKAVESPNMSAHNARKKTTEFLPSNTYGQNLFMPGKSSVAHCCSGYDARPKYPRRTYLVHTWLSEIYCCNGRILPSTTPAGHNTPCRSCSGTCQDMIRETAEISLD